MGDTVNLTDLAETRRLRQLIERPERCTFWGQPHTRTPRLIATVFGDGGCGGKQTVRDSIRWYESQLEMVARASDATDWGSP